MTEKGPRSKTLTTFSVMTPGVIARASARSAKPLDARELERVARRAGATVATPAPDRVACELLGELSTGGRPRPVLSRLLLHALGAERGPVSDAAQSAATWIAVTAERRADALWDLLLLADHLPPVERNMEQKFPRLSGPRHKYGHDNSSENQAGRGGGKPE